MSQRSGPFGDVVQGQVPRQRAAATPGLEKDPPPVTGELAADPTALSATADDFGHLIHRTPQYVLKPASVADISTVVAWAASQGLKVAARGQGHSNYGRPMVQGGVVIDMSTLNTIHSIAPDRVVVDAGAKWSAVIDAALAHGLTPPVLTAYIELSVGGTLSVGGIGGMSHLYGMQTDNVLDLDVVVAGGRNLTCSATQNADLFDAVRAGLGQAGIITRVTLKLITAPARVRRYQLFYPDQATLTADQREVLGERRFQHLQGGFIPNGSGGWRFQLEGGVFYTGSPPDDNVVADISSRFGSRVTCCRGSRPGHQRRCGPVRSGYLLPDDHWRVPDTAAADSRRTHHVPVQHRPAPGDERPGGHRPDGGAEPDVLRRDPERRRPVVPGHRDGDVEERLEGALRPELFATVQREDEVRPAAHLYSRLRGVLATATPGPSLHRLSPCRCGGSPARCLPW